MMNIIGNAIGSRRSGSSVNEAFEFTVQTDNAGTSAANQFTIPITSATPYDIKTSDGQTITGATYATTLTFPSPGTYTIKITESCEGWRFGGGGDKLKMLNVSNWGVWANTSDAAFFLATNMTCTATDKPTGIHTRMDRAFHGCVNFNGAIQNWDVSTVTRFEQFANSTLFNQDISGWDVAGASLKQMFYGASHFNQDISSWDTSGANDMSLMFFGASSFNQPIGNWDVSNVTNMSGMFQNATFFNQDISSWNVSNVLRAERMFSSASSFNQDLPNWTWTNLEFQGLDYMFERAYAFNGDLSNWTFPNVTRLNSTFDGVNGAMAFNNSSIANWDVSNITLLGNTFRRCESFNVDLSSWNTASLTNMNQTFFNCTSFNQPLNTWNVSNVTTFSYCFYFATSFNQPLDNWDVSSCTRFNQMFYQATSFNQDIGNWNMSSAVSGDTFKEMFRNAFAYDNGGQPINWITVAGPTDISQWFFNTPAFTQSLQSINITTAVNSLNLTFNSNITTPNYDATLVAWESQLQAAYPGGVGYTAPSNSWQFSGATYTLGSSAETARTSLVNTYGWTITDGGGIAVPMIITIDTTLGDGLDNYTLNFTGTGYDIETSDGQTITGATTATTINFASPGTYDIEISGDVSTRTFANDLKLVDIKKWGSIDTPLDDKFSGANSLTTITAPDQPVNLNMTRLFKNAQNFAGGISHWDVSNIASFQRAFYNTSFDEDISSWDTSSANTFSETFWGTPFNNGGQPGISNWNVSNVADFKACFTGTPFNQPIGSWAIKTSGPVRMDYMFSQTTAFNQDLSTWDVSGVTIMTRMFNVASSFNGDVSNWDVSGVTDLGYMFERARSFNHPGIVSWNTSGATSMASMFDGVNGGMAFNQDISGWDVSNVLLMNNMFRGCYSLNQPFNSWNTSSLQSMSQMFFNCYSFNQPLNLWNTSNVTNMQNVFYGATAFNQDISSWDITKVTIFNSFFTTTAFSTDNYDAVLVSWEDQLQVAYPGGAGYTPIISIHFGNSQYTLGSSAETARTSLINTYGWTITDGGGI